MSPSLEPNYETALIAARNWLEASAKEERFAVDPQAWKRFLELEAIRLIQEAGVDELLARRTLDEFLNATLAEADSLEAIVILLRAAKETGDLNTLAHQIFQYYEH